MSRWILLSAALVAFPCAARAGAPSEAERRFDEGKALIASGQVAEACAAFEASNRLEPGIGTTLHLARCRETLGELAAARATFDEARVMANARGDTKRAEVAEKYMRALDARIEAQPKPQVEASPEAPEAIAAPTPVHAEPAREGTWAGMHTGAVISGSVGVTAIIVGAVFGVRAFDQWHDAEAACTTASEGMTCTAAGVADADAATVSSTVSTMAFVGGGVAVGVGLLLWALAPSNSEPSSVAILPMAAEGELGIQIGGSF